MATGRAIQSEVVIGIIAGVSLIVNLLSAGNFIPSSEMWFFQTILSYLHFLLNWAGKLYASNNVNLAQLPE